MALTFFGGLRPLRGRQVARDVLAGINLASVNIPQVLGYTRIAGTHLVTGLYTLLLPLLVFAIFGSSRHLVVAADSATAAIFSSSVSHMASAGSDKYMALVGLIALLTAALLLLARIFKLGFLADFLSRTVLVGFLAGVGVQVATSMLRDMVGVDVNSRSTLIQAWAILHGLKTPHVATIALSAFVATGILLANRFAPRLPFSFLMVVGVIAASAYFHLAERGIALIGPVPGGLPALHMPQVSWNEVLELLPIAASCFVIIIAQSAATAQAFAARDGDSVDENADILGLSAANLAASISGAFVVNGSPTQTATAVRLGARTQAAQLVLAGVVMIVLLMLTGPLQYLPRCALAAIVFTIAVGMVDVKCLRDIRQESPGEFYLAIITALTVVAVGVEQGILLAIALSLLMHVRHSYRPHTTMLAPDSKGLWIPAAAVAGKETAPGLIIYRFGADLFYANRALFANEVRALVLHAPSKLRWFILDAGAITDIDYSASKTLCGLLGELASQHVGVIFGRVNAYLRADMDRLGITATIGEAHIFVTLHDAIAATKEAGPGSSESQADQTPTTR